MYHQNITAMKSNQITREKFFDASERKAILQTVKRKAEEDIQAGRKKWPFRFMLLHLLFYSGLRIAEACALRVSDLYLDVSDAYLLVRKGKGNKKRTVYINSQLAADLLQFVQGKDPESYLFSCKGRKYTTCGAWRAFKACIKAAGLRNDLTVHSCRHTFATYLLHHTRDLRFVQNQLGHSSPETTAIYANILPEDNGRLANMMRSDISGCLSTTESREVA